MQISILHLSDLHFKAENNSIFEKQNQFFDAIKNNLNISKYLFILITGDIANIGIENEYIEFKKFIKNFEEKISSYYSNKICIEYILTPGNHDCDFSISTQSIRDVVIEKILSKPNEISIDYVDLCAEVQKAYFKLVEELHTNSKLNSNLSNKLLYRYEYDIDGKYKVSFNSYNFSFMSRRQEKQSELVFPINLINKKEILSLKKDFRLNISLFHHPLHWLKHTSIRDFTEFINESSDIVLSGHEHTASGKEIKDIYTQDYIEYIESGSLQTSYDTEDSKFNLINIDLEFNNQEIFKFYWEENGYSKKIAEQTIVPNNTKNGFSLNSDYKEKISNLDIRLNHPRKENILLEDLFVYPDLKILESNKTKKNNSLEFNSKELIENKPGYIIFYGSDNAGKTSLLKKLQISYKKIGLIPIYIDGKEIRSNHFQSNNIKSLVLKFFKNQYNIDDKQILRNFEQSDFDEIVLLIDDFDLMKINNDNKGLFVDNLKIIGYKNLMFFSNETIIFEATSESELAKSLNDFEHYNILKFGYKLRDKLITKWITLGQELEIDQKKLILERKEKAEAIKNTIGLNLVPSRPFYIITLLQSIQMHENHQLDKSSYGNYYHYLIMKNINNPTQMKPSDINTIFAYASTLAFEMFKNKDYVYSVNEIYTFDSRYKQIRPNFTPSFNIMDKLVNSGILKNNEDNFSFSHKYIYYYFVAYYFSKNIDKDEYTDIIKKMTQRMYRIEFANILMFILHFVPQKFVIEMLLDEADKTFKDIREFKFQNDEIKKINKLIENDTSHKLEKRSIQEAHSLEVEKQDELEKKVLHQIDDFQEIDYDEELQELDLFNQLNLAFKLIEILGEVTKNYAGSLDGDISDKLIKYTYGLGLRSLKNIISMFEENHELLINHIVENINKKYMVNNENIKKEVSKSVFMLVSAISTDSIKKIAKAIGTKDLKKTYKEISNAYPDNKSYEIIKTAIDLSFVGGLNNESKLIKFHKQLEKDKNLLANSTLKHLVLDHLYMFENDHSKKTSICKQLGISTDSSKKALIQQSK